MRKVGEILDEIGKPGNFEEVHFFPVSAPVSVVGFHKTSVSHSKSCIKQRFHGAKVFIKHMFHIERVLNSKSL